MVWVTLAFELLKGIAGIVTEAVGASAKQLEELETRFMELLRVGLEELTAARADAKANVARSDEKEAAAIARIRAARVAKAAASAPAPVSDPVASPVDKEEVTVPGFNAGAVTPKPEDR